MNDESDPRLRRALAALPEPPLPGALWPQVARARGRQLARRRTALAGGAAAVLALLVLPGRLPVARDDFAPVVASARTVPAAVAAEADPDARLRTLDRELQAAYRRGSGDAEIAQLWEARAALLRERGHAASVRPVRI